MSLRRLAILPLAGLLCALPAPGRADSAKLAKGTSFDLVLLDPLSSESAHVGDRFRARLSSAVQLEDGILLPPDTLVEGRVLLVRSTKDGARSAALGVGFDRLQVPGGEPVSLAAGLASRHHDDDRPVMEPHAVLPTDRHIDVVFIGRTQLSDVRAHTLVGIDGQDMEELADHWAHSALGPEEVVVPAGAVVKLALDHKAKLHVPEGMSAATFTWPSR